MNPPENSQQPQQIPPQPTAPQQEPPSPQSSYNPQQQWSQPQPAPFVQAAPAASPQPGTFTQEASAAPQPVQPMQPIAPNSAYPTYAQPAPMQPSAPMPAGSGEDAKISSPKYWLTIVGITIVYAVLNAVGRTLKISAFVQDGVVIGAAIASWVMVSNLKREGRAGLTAGEKYKTVCLMTLAPIIAQAICYYRLKHTSPQLAKTMLTIGWKVLGVVLLVVAVIVAIMVVFAVAFVASTGQYSH